MEAKKLQIPLDDNITCTIILTPFKQSKRINMRIDNKKGIIRVTFNPRMREHTVLDFIYSHKKWIKEHLEKIPKKSFLSDGQPILFNGEQYMIVHIEKPRGVHVYDKDYKIFVECPTERLPRAIQLFLKKEALETIIPIAKEKAALLGKKLQKIAVRDTTSRWGSCTSSGNMSFSWRLIMAPPFVLDYLVAHEVAHLAHMNHSTQFWRTCAELSQDMAGAKIWLRKNGNLLHRYE